jgi:HTH-type transcriptional regulator, glycine betaine synthesis regulator
MARRRDKTATARRDIEDAFIEHWGEIAALWGVNKSVGRVQALLYLSEQPLEIPAVTERLQISHGNASTSIRELIGWGVVRRVHKPGERQAYFEAESDPWTWFHTTIRERRRREVAPVFERLSEIADTANQAARAARANERAELAELHRRINTFAEFSEEFIRLIDLFLVLGAGRFSKVLRAASKLAPKPK